MILPPEATPIVSSEHAHRLETALINVRELMDGPHARDRLRALLFVDEVLRHEIDAAVRDAREMRMTWQAIGNVFGMTRQSAHARWGRADEDPGD